MVTDVVVGNPLLVGKAPHLKVVRIQGFAEYFMDFPPHHRGKLLLLLPTCPSQEIAEESEGLPQVSHPPPEHDDGAFVHPAVLELSVVSRL
jgi:hypothetical protein